MNRRCGGVQDVLNSAVATKGVQHAALPKLRETVKNLQDVATREPQVNLAPDLLFFFCITLKPKFE